MSPKKVSATALVTLRLVRGSTLEEWPQKGLGGGYVLGEAGKEEADGKVMATHSVSAPHLSKP